MFKTTVNNYNSVIPASNTTTLITILRILYKSNDVIVLDLYILQIKINRLNY